MPKIKNEHYKKFLSGDLIKIVTREDIEKVLDNLKDLRVRGCDYKLGDQARALVFISWATGARPCEIADMTAGDVTREGSYIKVKLRGAKGAFSRIVTLPLSDPLVKEFYQYTKGMPPIMYLFWFFRSKYNREKTKAKIKIRGENGEIKEIVKEYQKPYPRSADKMTYYFKRWFSEIFPGGVPPYYLRHNRFSSLAEKGKSLEEIRMLKGAKTYDSVVVYTHVSTEMAKKMAKDLVR